jgi:hypothetical protein
MYDPEEQVGDFIYKLGFVVWFVTFTGDSAIIKLCQGVKVNISQDCSFRSVKKIKYR